MNNGLSVWHLVSNASWVVQAVMLILLLASMVSWMIIVKNFLAFRHNRAQLYDFDRRFWSGGDLSQLYRQLTTKDSTSATGQQGIFVAGFREYTRLRQQGGVPAEVILQGTTRAMRVMMSREEERLEKGLPFLATVGSTSPYVGLFGTVWGIMQSFIGLSQQAQATLAVVAPGIAEALIATAMGLVAAIPAVVAYNRYAAHSQWVLNRYDTFAQEFSSILHRQVHGGVQSAPTSVSSEES